MVNKSYWDRDNALNQYLGHCARCGKVDALRRSDSLCSDCQIKKAMKGGKK